MNEEFSATITKYADGWRVYSHQAREFLGPEFHSREVAIDALVAFIKSHCEICGHKLRTSEGEGPCSDCMGAECRAKDAEEIYMGA